MQYNYVVLILLSILLLVYCNNETLNVNDNNNNKNCIKAKVGDHVMIEYQVVLKDGNVVMARQKPDQLFHFIIEESVSE